MLNRREFQQQLAAAGVAGMTALIFPGCTTRTEVADADGGDAKGPIVIGMIAKSQSNPVFQAARKGAEAKAAALSKSMGREIKVDWRTPNDEDPQKQAEFIEQLVAAGANAITIACSDASKVSRVIDDAVAKGVTVMCFDSDAPDSKRLCYVGTDDTEAGKQIMQEVGKLLEGREGDVAILGGNQTATNLQKRVKGAQEAAKSFPNIKSTKEVYHKETPQDAYAAVEAEQSANSNLIGWAMIGGWPLMTERHMPWDEKQVVCASMDTLPPQLGHLKLGDVQVLLGQQYFYFGGQCVQLLVDKIVSGKDPAKAVDFAPLDRVTKENVDAYAKNWETWS